MLCFKIRLRIWKWGYGKKLEGIERGKGEKNPMSCSIVFENGENDVKVCVYSEV